MVPFLKFPKNISGFVYFAYTRFKYQVITNSCYIFGFQYRIKPYTFVSKVTNYRHIKSFEGSFYLGSYIHSVVVVFFSLNGLTMVKLHNFNNIYQQYLNEKNHKLFLKDFGCPVVSITFDHNSPSIDIFFFFLMAIAIGIKVNFEFQ